MAKVYRTNEPGFNGSNTIEVIERFGRTEPFGAVVSTVQSWLLSTGIDTDEAMFPAELWTAIERSHYILSSKTFVMVDRPF